MPTSHARIAANRANARRSTGPRSPEGKARSSRNALAHGAYASDDTLLALASPSPSPPADPPRAPRTRPDARAPEPPLPPHAAADQPPSPSSASSPRLRASAVNAPNPHLAAFTAHFRPQGPVEHLLVRRLAATATRLDLLSSALDSLLELDERRALLDHLEERYALDRAHLRTRSQPVWSHQLLAYDGQTADPMGQPLQTDPDLDPSSLLAYTLSSPRAALLMRHEAAAERRFHHLLRELTSLQAIRLRPGSHLPPGLIPTHQPVSTSASVPCDCNRRPGHPAAGALGATPTSPIIGNEPNGAVNEPNAAAGSAPIAQAPAPASDQSPQPLHPTRPVLAPSQVPSNRRNEPNTIPPALCSIRSHPRCLAHAIERPGATRGPRLCGARSPLDSAPYAARMPRVAGATPG